MELNILQSASHNLVGTLFRAEGNKGNVILVQPFGEELNRSRHSLATMARELVSAGYSALMIDLYGTGDSDGDIDDATVEIWLEDICAAVTWMRAELPGPTILGGLRLGANLALDAANRIEDCQSVILISPITNCRRFLRQFLRIRTAANALSDKGSAETVSALEDRLMSGERLDVGGYRLTSELAAGIRDLDLNAVQEDRRRACGWIEIGSEVDSEPSKAVASRLEVLSRSGQQIDYAPFKGPLVWNQIEPETLRGLGLHVADYLQKADAQCQ